MNAGFNTDNKEHLVIILDPLYRDLNPEYERGQTGEDLLKYSHTKMILLPVTDATVDNTTADACKGWI